MHYKVLITGTTSIHGYPIFCHLCTLDDFSVYGIRSPKMRVPVNAQPLCITDRDGLAQIKHSFHPTHIVHCAGVCDLDVCEDRPEWAESMNTDGARAVCEVFGDNCHIIYLSADLIFSGNTTPLNGYREIDTPDPVSVAGKTILAAENVIRTSDHHTVIRLGLPIGGSVDGTKGAVDFIDYRLRRSLPITLFHDEYRSCIACEDISTVIEKCIRQNIEGLYHLGGPKRHSLHDIGRWVLVKGRYDSSCLKTISRVEEIGGPPRMGDVSLDSSKILNLLQMDLCSPI
ncbi:MAG TPA: sugar nucleotide-binding protein [Chitinispirillaceae bacterium]|nr:sugar nucleotide-binding protein [Chitinispirillaceae bacterium]